jgi:hypothetical protein
MSIDAAKAHKPQLIKSADAHATVHGDHPIGRANAWLAVKITRAVGSMWCAYAFALLALVSLPAALHSGDKVIVVSWISQTFLQLVLLSVIVVGQNVQAAASDARAEADHETLAAVHTLTVAVHAIDEQQTVILHRLDGRA